MRIAYVLKKFPRISETFILNEILELTGQGAEVTVFSLHKPDDGLFHRKLSELKTPVVYLPARKSQAFLAHLQENLPLLRQARDGLGHQLEALLEEKRSDVWSILRWGIDVALEAQSRGIQHLHAHFATIASYVARAANAISGIPYSFTCHAKDIYREGVQPLRFQRLAEPAAFIITVCDANKRHIEENLAGAAQISVVTLYNGIDLSYFHPKDRNPDKVPLLLSVGRLVEKKGFRYLVAAAANLLEAGEDFNCLIVGEGDERPRLEEQIKETRTDRIKLAGLMTQDATRLLFTRATMLALPCVIGADGNRDALPTVLLEAMASGVPVISTPVVGVEEIVDGGRAGVLVPVQDTKALEAEIKRLLHDPKAREDYGQKGRARAERCFDLHKNAATLLDVFRHGGAQA